MHINTAHGGFLQAGDFNTSPHAACFAKYGDTALGSGSHQDGWAPLSLPCVLTHQQWVAQMVILVSADPGG